SEAYSDFWLQDELLDRLIEYHRLRKGTPTRFDTMSGIQFEAWLIEEIKQAGIATVLPTRRTGDQGADVIVQHRGVTIVVQAKCYQHSVGNDAVQQAHAAKAHYAADHAWVVTNARFTPAARRLANSTGVRLVDSSAIEAVGHMIAEALQK